MRRKREKKDQLVSPSIFPRSPSDRNNPQDPLVSDYCIGLRACREHLEELWVAIDPASLNNTGPCRQLQQNILPGLDDIIELLPFSSKLFEFVVFFVVLKHRVGTMAVFPPTGARIASRKLAESLIEQYQQHLKQSEGHNSRLGPSSLDVWRENRRQWKAALTQVSFFSLPVLIIGTTSLTVWYVP